MSEQYTIETLTAVYQDSLLYEVRQESLVLYNLLSKAEWNVNEAILTLFLEDSFLARNKSQEIKQFLETIYKNRFQMELKVGFDYTEAQKKAFYEANRHKLNFEVNQIMDHLEMQEGIAKENSEKEDTKQQKETPKKAKESKEKVQKQEQKTFEKKNYSQRRSDDPDVFYGRNCDGELIPISEITEEIGEVVIHGKLLKLDTREIRSEKTILMFSITDFTDTIMVKIFVRNNTRINCFY